ncbi:Npun_R2821/Npun_R2822 family protein [Leptolyngbya sp. FACHB-17]|uniref:Npun_R2821/Npun_R2822 family protein n=1 Tax=unclassified Leptolyngbya TaxID=2650499 RepID=UPI00168057A3|nr:Npun_R2821/Npun_R2822 family protein [Leptolyngbya sp. FACHB-17]MBD2081028.1 methionine synthase [Leptolyngbya sp. FACHB-17]
MTSFGIYTLANDAVFDQLVALLNSIKANVDPDIPVCVIPFDDRLDRVKAEIQARPNVTLFQNQSSIDRWENFAREFVKAHPEAQRTQQAHPRWYKGKLHRKFAAFDGQFEQFVFFDGDSLAMKPLTQIWERLKLYDFVFDDWEHAKSSQNAALNIPLIEATGAFTESEIRPKLHCSSFFGSKRGIFDDQELAILQKQIAMQAGAAWVNNQGWWDDAFLFNYMTLRCDRPLFNFTLSPNGQERTGNCANRDPFVLIDHVLYNEQGLKPIHRIHYMGYSSTDFARFCHGEDVEIRYKEVFLHYRFLDRPEQKPSVLKPPSVLTKTGRLFQRAAQKLLR